MRTLLLLLLLLACTTNAFSPTIGSHRGSSTITKRRRASCSLSSNSNVNNVNNKEQQLSHADITWKLRRDQATPKADMEAWYNDTQIGRFGFLVEGGPVAPPMEETIQELYQDSSATLIAGIIYMFVEPEYRNLNVGTLALQVISLIHAQQDCGYTVLVVDDDGSGKLIRWYEQHGYTRAPKLQMILGSPDAKYGVSMIAPTNNSVPENCVVEWFG
jgi:GNAT superfamily N-acetyltransferase